MTGRGLGESFLRACLRFASATLGAQSYTLAVAAFNRRAITVYERAGFQEVDRFEHFTNGGRRAFIRMARSTIESCHDLAAARASPEFASSHLRPGMISEPSTPSAA
jgi:ribosomal protein S18 acetylase RimI-like enzyme